MADNLSLASGTADDFTDARGLGKLMWVLVAALRFVVAFLVIAAFLCGVLTLHSRFQADRALAGDQAAGLQSLAEFGGGAGISQAANKDLMEAARAAEQEITARQLLEQREAATLKDLEKYATQLQALAVRAGCSAGEIDAALKCKPDAAADPTLVAEFFQMQDLYRNEHKLLLETRAEALQQRPTYVAKLFAPGGDLARVLPALDARTEIERSVPSFLSPVVEWFFGLPLLVSSIIVAFLAGMFGAVAVLLVLLAFPAHAPLTFGGGKYFFLRMFTGGFVAVIVFMVIQSGLTFGGIGDLQAAFSGISVADPVKIALIGMFAGGFSEQLAGAVHRYVTQTLGGRDDDPADPAEAEPVNQFGAMGPGASAGH
ncbi:MAG TPA: hypothetical protein VG735_14375 [Caulobacterales bacterium]|nr:hypothetical protein [Caulobacterales bacterium]